MIDACRDILSDQSTRDDAVLVTALDGLDHLVSDHILAASHDGRFTAACGATVLSQSMCSDPHPLCPMCVPPLPIGPSARYAQLPVEMIRGLRSRCCALVDAFGLGSAASHPHS